MLGLNGPPVAASNVASHLLPFQGLDQLVQDLLVSCLRVLSEITGLKVDFVLLKMRGLPWFWILDGILRALGAMLCDHGFGNRPSGRIEKRYLCSFSAFYMLGTMFHGPSTGLAHAA